MRTKLANLALAGALGVTGSAGAALVAPAVSYAATGDTTALTERVDGLERGLSGLVSDGSITQSQADEVATLLSQTRPEGGGRRGGGGRVDPAVAAEALGITVEELRTATEAGKSLADIAEEEGVDQGELVDALVAAEREELAEAVSSGRLTQGQADERAATLEERITANLDELCGPGGRGGPGGPRDDSTAPSPAPSQAPSSDTPTAETSSA